MVIKETLRLYPITYLGRSITQDFPLPSKLLCNLYLFKTCINQMLLVNNCPNLNKETDLKKRLSYQL